MEDSVELTTYTSLGDAYVYAPLPAGTSYGHRAELWNPDKWMQEVKVKVITAGDQCFVRMMTKDTGELFAESPLPVDGTPLTTAVEPVVDSSRYFVIKVVDRESRNHAFIGVGFRDRMDASDFSAALDDYRQYLRRKQEAEQLRQEFGALQAGSSGPDPTHSEQRQGAEGVAEASTTAGAGGQKDFSLKPGETLHIKLSPSLKRADSSGKAGGAASILRTSSGGGSSPASSAVPGVIPRLAPPGSSSSTGTTGSSSGFFRLHPPPSTAAGTGAAAAAAAGATSVTQQPHVQLPAAAGAVESSAASPNDQGPGRPSVVAVASSTAEAAAGHVIHPSGGGGGAAAAAAAAAGADNDDDQWGDFVG